MKVIEEGQPFTGTVSFNQVHMSGEWTKQGDFMYIHLDPDVRQDVSLSATIRSDGKANHTIAIPLANVEMIILGE